MRRLKHRYGHVSKADKTVAELAQLREFVQHHKDVLDGKARPLSKHEAHVFAKLAWKHKYHPDFQDEIMVRHAGKPGRAPEEGDMPVMTNKVRIPGMY